MSKVGPLINVYNLQQQQLKKHQFYRSTYLPDNGEEKLFIAFWKQLPHLKEIKLIFCCLTFFRVTENFLIPINLNNNRILKIGEIQTCDEKSRTLSNAVWPEKNRQMSIKLAQKCFYYLFNFVLFKQFTNCRLQQDANLECHSRRRAWWLLGVEWTWVLLQAFISLQSSTQLWTEFHWKVKQIYKFINHLNTKYCLWLILSIIITKASST